MARCRGTKRINDATARKYIEEAAEGKKITLGNAMERT
jgi:hypothetical protein